MPIIITMINLIPDFNILSHEAQLFACFTHKESWQLLHVMWRRLLELFRWHPFLIPSWAVRPRLSILHYPLLPSQAKRRCEHYYSTNVTMYSLQPTARYTEGFHKWKSHDNSLFVSKYSNFSNKDNTCIRQKPCIHFAIQSRNSVWVFSRHCYTLLFFKF